jgi:hypothetical protein
MLWAVDGPLDLVAALVRDGGAVPGELEPSARDGPAGHDDDAGGQGVPGRLRPR